MPEFEINVCGVQKLLHTIKPNKASGPDSIPCRVLKEAASELAPALADIFNSSLSVGTLPDDWKTAHVAPAFKKGNTNAAENYRPISLTCVCCKLLEHIICHHIRAHLDNHNILSIFQHGFRSGHSCDSQLLSTVHDLMSIFDRKKQVDVAVLDFSKAFDVVPHQRLLGKLRHCGINGRALKWIADFLSRRTQRVVVDGAYSWWSPVHSGVPQGTVLGPLLFLIYINDLPDSVSRTVRLFADDCLVYREVGSIDDQLALQRDLDSLENWAHIWGMKFNPSKCTILTISRSPPLHKFYSLCGTILQQVSEAKYLGVNISEDLHWSKHIQGLASKASSTLGLLRRNLSLCPQKLREQAYISLIRSRLEYCAAIWDPHLEKDTQQLEAIQRRAARFVVQDFSRYSSVKSYLNDLKWAPLKDRRRDIRLTFLFKIVTGRVAVQAEGTLLPADSRTRHKHNTSIGTCQQPVTSAWTLSLSNLSPIGPLYQRRASQRILLPHSSHACAAPHSAALRYPPPPPPPPPPIGAILLRGLPIIEPEPEPELTNGCSCESVENLETENVTTWGGIESPTPNFI